MGFFEKFGKKAGETIAGILKGISSTAPEGKTIFDSIKTDNNLKDTISYDSFKSINKVVQSLNSSVEKLKSSQRNFSDKYKSFSNYYKKNYSKFSVLDEKCIKFDPQNIREKKDFDDICQKLNQISNAIKNIKIEFSDSAKAKDIIENSKFKVEIYKKIIDAIKKRNIIDLENLSEEIDDKKFKEEIKNIINEIKCNLDLIEENPREKIDIKKYELFEKNKKQITDLNEDIKKLEEEIKAAREKDKAEKLEKVKNEVLKLTFKIKIKKSSKIYSAKDVFIGLKDLFENRKEKEYLRNQIVILRLCADGLFVKKEDIDKSTHKKIDEFINDFYDKYNEYFTLKLKDLNKFNNKDTEKILKKLKDANKKFDELKKSIAKSQDELEKIALKNIQDARERIIEIEKSINKDISFLNNKIGEQIKIETKVKDIESILQSKYFVYSDLHLKIPKAYVAYINVLDNIIVECDNRKSKIDGACKCFETIKSKIDDCLEVFNDSSIDEIKKKVQEIRENKTKAEKLNSKITLGQVLSGVYYRMSKASESASDKIKHYDEIIEKINKERNDVDKAYKNTFSKYTGKTTEFEKLNDDKKNEIRQKQLKNL